MRNDRWFSSITWQLFFWKWPHSFKGRLLRWFISVYVHMIDNWKMWLKYVWYRGSPVQIKDTLWVGSWREKLHWCELACPNMAEASWHSLSNRQWVVLEHKICHLFQLNNLQTVTAKATAVCNLLLATLLIFLDDTNYIKTEKFKVRNTRSHFYYNDTVFHLVTFV